MAARGGRKIPKEVQAIFEKYQKNKVRKLHKPEALKMLMTEFNLSEDQAEQMFVTFDKDMNGDMSLWEFQQFYATIGNQAQEMVAKFQELDTDNSGKLDADEARKGLAEITVGGEHKLEEREIDFFIKTSIGDDNQIDLGHFCSLLFRLKVYTPPPKAK